MDEDASADQLLNPSLFPLQNQPLYLRVFSDDKDGELLLKLNHVVHCSLDALEERGALTTCTSCKGSWVRAL